MDFKMKNILVFKFCIPFWVLALALIIYGLGGMPQRHYAWLLLQWSFADSVLRSSGYMFKRRFLGNLISYTLAVLWIIGFGLTFA